MTPLARLQLCRDLRLRQTSAEAFFWELVRDRRFDGLKFRRQHPLSRFVADFCCAELRLAVELDGEIHVGQIERDTWRDAVIAGERGVRVVRIANDALIADPEVTLQRLRDLASDGQKS